MNQPNVDDLASVLASVIASSRNAEDIRNHTGLAGDGVLAIVTTLSARYLIRDVGGGLYHATQTLCAGPCSRGGRSKRGHVVVINPVTLRWMCADCWDATTEPPQEAAASGDREDDHTKP